MSARSMMDVHAALARGAPDEVIGCPEGRDIDFKRDAYVLTQPRKKWELAKDVAAFANAGGGLIVLGVRTERRETCPTEDAAEVCPVRKTLVDFNKYRDAIANGITPFVDGVELRWFPEDPTIDHGVLTIYVPSQAERSKPFVLRRMVDESGGEIAAFAIPKRNEDRTEWLSADQVQMQLALLSLLGSAGGVPPLRSPPQTEGLDDRLVDLIRELGADDEPCLALQLVPPEALDLSLSLFGQGGIVGRLRGWEGIRRMGFDLGSEVEPEPRGVSVLFGGGRWRGRIDSDGTLGLVIPVRWEFLGWAMNKDGRVSANLRINAVPLVEVVYDFFRLAHSILLPRTRGRAWTARTRAWRMQAGGVLMHAGVSRQAEWFFPRPATSDNFDATSFETTEAPERDAFHCLARIYGLWGMGPEDVPLARDGSVDPDAIRALRG